MPSTEHEAHDDALILRQFGQGFDRVGEGQTRFGVARPVGRDIFRRIRIIRHDGPHTACTL